MLHTDPKIQELTDSYGDWFKQDSELQKGRMTSKLYPYTEMFSPIKINRMTVKNRLVMAPMGNISMCEETGRPNDKMLQYFFARAKGGVGLITSGLVPISHGIDNSITELGKLTYFPRIDRSRTVFAGWRDLAQGIHSYGSRFFIQLTPGLGRVGNPQCLVNSMKFPGSASMNPSFYIPQIPCLRLSGHKLKKIIKNAGQAAADSKACGIDGVYLHGHEGYLLEQMTNPAFNRRKLGRFANYENFGLDMVREIRRRAGDSYPIMYRIDLSLALNETYGEEGMNVKSLKKFKNGRSIQQTLEYMKHLALEGVDMFDVDLGCYDNWWLPHPPSSMPPACFTDISKIVKDYFKENNILSNAGVEIPIVAVGKLGYPDTAEQTLRDGKCDMIMLGRPLLADAEWANKAYAGEVDKIRPCIGCQEGCINEFVDGGHPQCAVNPRTSFEHLIPEVLPKAEVIKKVAVIGAGPTGVMAAVTAAKRGHDVTLIEKSGKIGGKIIPGSVPKIKFDIDNYRIYLENTVNDMVKEGKLTFVTGVTADPSFIKENGFDAVIVAAGFKESTPKLPGIESANTVLATELLNHPEKLGNAKRIVVVGGGVVGCETAYWLHYEKNCDVTVVEMTEYFMNHVCTANRGHLIHYLQKGGVSLLNCTKVSGFEGSMVNIKHNVSKTVPDPYVTWHPILPENVENPLAVKLKTEEKAEAIPADLVVLAMGGKPDDTLFFECQKNNVSREIYNIGDSFSVGKVLEATRAAFNLAIKL